MLRNFIAVMKDSFREAVDGFIIYVMLGLAVLTIVIVASISFEPQSGDEAFNNITKRFTQVFRNRGTDNEEIGTRVPTFVGLQRIPIQLNYKAYDVQKLDGGKDYAGKYKLRVRVEPGEGGDGGNPFARQPFNRVSTDLFPALVYLWSQPKTPEQYVLVGDDTGKGIQSSDQLKFEPVPDGTDPDEALATRNALGGRWIVVASPKPVPAAEAKGVSNEAMEDFIRNQFLIHGDISGVTVKRRLTEADKYEFDVEAEVPGGAKGWPHQTKIFFGAQTLGAPGPLGPGMYLVEDLLVNTIGASVTLLVAVILTGFFIPNMLRKGSLDLVMAKPMARWELLLYKYIGGLIFMLLITSVTVGGVWLVLAVRSGSWNPAFLLSIPIITFTFAVLYAVSTLVAVLTRSAIAAILVTALFMVLMWAVGFTKSWIDNDRSNAFKEQEKSNAFFSVVDITNAVLPRYNDVLKLNSNVLVEAICPPSVVKANTRGESPSWVPSIGISLAYIAGFLGLAYLRFATRDP
jgi:ABC-type transport system involved in multi-copper enzyme maturation permease subunit